MHTFYYSCHHFNTPNSEISLLMGLFNWNIIICVFFMVAFPYLSAYGRMYAFTIDLNLYLKLALMVHSDVTYLIEKLL